MDLKQILTDAGLEEPVETNDEATNVPSMMDSIAAFKQEGINSQNKLDTLDRLYDDGEISLDFVQACLTYHRVLFNSKYSEVFNPQERYCEKLGEVGEDRVVKTVGENVGCLYYGVHFKQGFLGFNTQKYHCCHINEGYVEDCPHSILPGWVDAI